MIDDEIVAALEKAGLKSGEHYIIEGNDPNEDVPGNEYRVIEPKGINYVVKLEHQHKVRDTLKGAGFDIIREVEDEGKECLMVRRS